MGNREVKMKIEIGDYKFECRGDEQTLVELAVEQLQIYKKKLKPY